MASLEELLADFDSAAAPDLSTGEEILGAARSYLSGPLFNFQDEVEAGIASLFTPLSYDEELANIRSDQARYEKAHPNLSTAIELGSSVLANPASKVSGLVKGANKGLTTAARVLTNPGSQAAAAAVGAAEGDDNLLLEAGKGLALGVGGSAAANVAGRTLQGAAKQANRLKLSAFGINMKEIERNIKKLGDDVDAIEEVPLLSTVERAEKAGIITAGDDALHNFGGVIEAQEEISGKLRKILTAADEVLPPVQGFSTPRTEKYIKSFAGTAKDKAEETAIAEYNALINQMENGGTLADLQTAKLGLNYKWDQNPHAESIIKALRSDIRAEIENRVNLAAKSGALNRNLQGSIRSLNQEWGQLAELKDVFTKQLAKDYGGDAIEDLFGSIATTRGAGSLNIMSVISGNPVYAALGAAANAARAPEAKNAIADTLREFRRPIEAVGNFLTGDLAPITARSTVQIAENVKDDKKPKKTKATKADTSGLEQLLKDFDSAGGETKPSSKAADEELSLFSDDPVNDELLDAVRQVESAGGKRLYSPAGAIGPYQFMPKTGKAYGLETVADMLDETKSRSAARKLLQDEYGALGDIALALAAYNAGRPAVLRAMNADPNDDDSFEAIAPYLADETENYVPLIYAALEKLKEKNA